MVGLVVRTKQPKQLFDFQTAAIGNINKAVDSGNKAILLISLMGSGKTVMASALVSQYIGQGKRVLILVHIVVLTNQIINELNECEIPHTVLQGSRKYNPNSQVIIASAQTIEKRLSQGFSLEQLLGSIDLMLFDEAHELTYRQVSQQLYKQYVGSGILVGLTATPWRLNKKEYLGQYYSHSIVTLQPPELIKMGRAVPCRIFGFEDYFDLDKIKIDADGDFNEQDMARQGIQIKNLEKVYRQWIELTPGYTTIVFAATVVHAQAIADYFSEQGVKSDCISGNTPEPERRRLFEALDDGSLTVLSSVNTLIAGFDCPRVQCVVYVRLTESQSGYHQACGRAARVYPGKDFYYILDFGANYIKMGNPMSEQNYSIDQKKEGEARLKKCPGCGEMLYMFARICPICGYEFLGSETEDEPIFDEIDLDIDEVMVEFFSREDRGRLHWFRSEKRKSYADILDPQTATNKFKKKYGFFPPIDWSLHAVFGSNPTEQDAIDFEAYLNLFSPHEYWTKVHMAFEFGQAQIAQKRPTNKKTKTVEERNRERKEARNKNQKARYPDRFTRTILDWHDIFGCGKNATTEEVKLRYRELARRWHPDICKDPVAEEKMKEINFAYDEFLKYQSSR